MCVCVCATLTWLCTSRNPLKVSGISLAGAEGATGELVVSAVRRVAGVVSVVASCRKNKNKIKL